MKPVSTTTPAGLQKNVLRQARRLSLCLDIPLTYAKQALAQSAYACASWEDLMMRLQTGEPNDAALLLAHCPASSAGSRYLARNMPQIARAIARGLLTNQNLMGMCDVLRQVFDAQEKRTRLSDIVDSLSAAPWYTTDIGDDPQAVIESHVKINGVTVKLIGTRTYLPEHLNLGDDLQEMARYAAHFGRTLEIMWSEPSAWHAAARAYLAPRDDDMDDTPLTLPTTELSPSMQKHEAWFRKVLHAFQSGSKYGEEDESAFIPLVTSAGCYVVFGLPSPDQGGTAAPDHAIDISRHFDNDSTLVLIEGLPACIESLSVAPATGKHDGLFGDYYDLVLDSLMSHADCDMNACLQNNGGGRIFFIRPASRLDVRMHMALEVGPIPGHEAWTLKTDHIRMADEVLQRVADRNVTSFKDNGAAARYLVDLDVSHQEDCTGLSLSLEVIGGVAQSWSNLILGTISFTCDDGSPHILVELSERIFALVELVGKKRLLEAARHGLVLQRPEGLHDALDRPPRWCSSLNQPSVATMRMFERRFESLQTMSWTDLWRHARTTTYRKDNF